MMSDQFFAHGDNVSAPARAAVAVVAHDGNALPVVPKALFVGTGGTLVAAGVGGGADVVFRNVADGTLLPFWGGVRAGDGDDGGRYRGALLMLGLGLGVAGGSGRGSAGRPETWVGPALRALWDAERVGSLQLAGANVTAWTDVAEGLVASQAVSGSKPLYLANGFGGRAGLLFDGTDDFVNLESAPFPYGAAASEIWVLADWLAPASETAVRTLVSYGGTGTTDSRRLQRVVASGRNVARIAVGTGSAVQTVTGASDYSGRHLASGAFAATSRITIDGVVEASNATSTNTTAARTRIGARATATAAEHAHFIVSAVAIIDPAQPGWTEAKAARLTRWMKMRGGL